jgi:hypothetical protein
MRSTCASFLLAPRFRKRRLAPRDRFAGSKVFADDQARHSK